MASWSEGAARARALLGAALCASVSAALLASCAPPPPPLILMMGERDIEFRHAQMRLTGGGEEPVGLQLLSQEDVERSDGLILRLVLFERPGVKASAFAGNTYSSDVELGRPGSAWLELVSLPEHEEGQPRTLVAKARQLVFQRVELTVRACAPGILHADGWARALGPDGLPVEVGLMVELR